jgi:hypothetical protein
LSGLRQIICIACGDMKNMDNRCVKCKPLPERISHVTGLPVRKKREKGAPKADKRRKAYRNRLRSKTVWDLAELVQLFDDLLEYDTTGSVVLYQDRLAEAKQAKLKVAEVLQLVQRAYELTARYPTRALQDIRKRCRSMQENAE